MSGDVRASERGGRRSSDSARLDPHPRLAGYRVTDASALLGAVVWLALVAASTAGALPLTLVEQFVALALLVLVPLGLGIAASPTDRGASALTTGGEATTPSDRPFQALPFRLAVLAQFPCALAASTALALPVESRVAVLLSVPWLGVTGAVAVTGLWRLLARGLWPVEELAIDAALLYVPVGAVALLLHRAGISLQFRPIVVLLTAIHYHYAGFVLVLVAGRVGRILARAGALGDDLGGRATQAALFVVVGNVGLIAVGITFSPVVEIVAVALFAGGVVALALVTLRRVVPELDGRRGPVLGLAFATLLWTMALALAYGYSAFPATGHLVSITQMIRLHGVVNALAFALPALLVLRLRDADR